jgi:molybdate transport system substrate-binding protein
LRLAHRPSRLAAALAVVALLLAGCGGNDDIPPGAGETSTLTVFAAASLTEAFTAIKPDFEAAGDGVTVRFNFAGSQALAGQIQHGAPADVFASADTANMEKLTAAGLVDGEPAPFAGNQLQIAVAKGNPEGVKGLADLARTDLKVVLGAEEVPAGKYARQALDKAGVTVQPASLEENVKAAVTKVGLGEADATIVYVTDVTAAKGSVEGVDIPQGQNVAATYPVAVVKGSGNAAAGKAFTDYLRSEAGQSKLQTFGFLPAAN